MSMYTKAFWKATGERVIASMAGGVIAVFTADGFDVAQANWKSIAIAAATTGAVSLFKALVASNVGNAGPSLVQSEKLAVEVEPYVGRHAESMGSDTKADAAYHDGH